MIRWVPSQSDCGKSGYSCASPQCQLVGGWGFVERELLNRPASEQVGITLPYPGSTPVFLHADRGCGKRGAFGSIGLRRLGPLGLEWIPYFLSFIQGFGVCTAAELLVTFRKKRGFKFSFV